MERRRYSSGSPFEPQIGFSRAVRSGNVVAIAGTAPLGLDGETVGAGDAAAQATRCFEIIQQALEGVGASLADVVRTRVYLTDIEDWQAVGQAHGEFFRDVRPVCTFLEVSRLIDPEWRVEVEADAVVGNGPKA